MNWGEFFWSFLKASTFSVGGLSSLPLLREDLVGGGLVTERQVLEALAIARLSPGPSGLFLVSLGYFAAGVGGATLALVAGIIPPLTFVVLTGFFRKQLMSAWAAGVIRGMALSTAGLVIATGIELLSPEGAIWTVPAWQLLLAIAAVLLTVQGKIHPGLIIGAGALAGLLLGPS